ncbi:cupredoxin domain-containing protein [Streptomyces sp. 5.8]|uniref:cupredoxin domain-containing protein n=1 Tax=Streptomyces sp. 5.8 TaxID=3406571 RepID=UPI003BB79DA5
MSITRSRRIRNRTRGAAVGAACALLAIVGATSSGSAAPTSRAGTSTVATEGTNVRIRGFNFIPAEVKARPGASVTVMNQDSAPHTLTAAQGDAFDTDMIVGGTSATFTAPSKPDSYPFFCSIHPQMQGTLIIA